MRNKTISAVSLAAFILAAALPTYAQTPPLLKVAVGNDYVEIDSTGAQYYGGMCNATACLGSSMGTIAGSILWTGTIDGFSVYGLNGVTPVPAAPQIDIGETGIVAPGAGGTITISYTATGFTVGASPAMMNVVPGTAVSQTYTSYVDDTNAPFGTQITVGTLGSAGGMLNGEGPLNDSKGFSITDVETIQLAAGATFNSDFNLQVAPHAPLLLTCSPASGTVGKPFSSLLTATGGDTPYTYSITGGPSWLKVNASTGALSGTPTAAGQLSFTATVMDSSGITGANSVSTSCMIGINQSTGQNPPPTLKVACPTSTATVGVAYSSSVGVTGGTPPYKYAIVYGSLPAGLVLNSNGTITGTPTQAGQTGAFKIQVTDSSSPAQVAYTNCSGSCSNGTTVSWGGSGNPQSGWGQKSWTSSYSSNNVNLNVYGWDLHGNHANLYSNNFGGNSYLGISNDQWGGNQIDSQHFVQCDLSDAINKGATGASITLSSTGWGVSYDIYGSNTLGQLGTLLQSNVQVNPWSQSGQSVSVPQFGKYKYICVKAHSGSSGGVSICNISCNFPCSCAIDVGQSSNQGGSGYGGSGYGGSGYGGSGYGGSGYGGSGYGGSGYGGSGYGGSGYGGSGYGGSGSGSQQGSGSGQCGW